MKNTHNFDIYITKSSPDSSQKTMDEFSSRKLSGGQGDGPAKETVLEIRSAGNKIEQYIKRNSFHLNTLQTNNNQENRDHTRNKKASNQTETNSNQKGANYVKQ